MPFHSIYSCFSELFRNINRKLLISLFLWIIYFWNIHSVGKVLQGTYLMFSLTFISSISLNICILKKKIDRYVLRCVHDMICYDFTFLWMLSEISFEKKSVAFVYTNQFLMFNTRSYIICQFISYFTIKIRLVYWFPLHPFFNEVSLIITDK